MKYVRSSAKYLFLYFPNFAAIWCIAIGLVVMLAWIGDIRFLKSLAPNFASMKFSTALNFFCCGLSMLAILRQSGRFWRQLAAVPILFTSLITLNAYIFNISSIFDEFLVPATITNFTVLPGRMSLGTTSSFVALGVALFFYEQKPRMTEALAVFSYLLALTVLFGYAFDVEALYDVFPFNTVAFHTALSFLFFTLGLILGLPQGLIRGMLSNPSLTGKTIRFLMPFAIIIPFCLGLFSIQAVRANWYDASFALVMMSLSSVILLSVLVFLYGRAVSSWEQRAYEIQRQLFESEIARIRLEKEQEVLTVKKRFLAMLTHDMKNPVSSIILASDLLLSYDERLDIERRKTHLTKIRRQAFSILALVEDLMLVSNIQLHGLPLHLVYEDIVEFCKDYFNQFVELESHRPHEFSLDVPNETVYTVFDAKLMRRVLDNLLRNAVKYSPHGGKICLAIKSNGAELALSVSDTGIGIPAENFENLFVMFNRADNVGEIAGYGLGLAIVKEIIDRHGGKIEVESEVGKGTKFTITLMIQKNLGQSEDTIALAL